VLVAACPKFFAARRAKFDLYASELVVQEVRAGDAQLASRRLEFLAGVPLLPVSGEILELARN
jgi:hypothetical protein